MNTCPVPGCGAPLKSGRFVCGLCWDLASPTAQERLKLASHHFNAGRRTVHRPTLAERRAEALHQLIQDVRGRFGWTVPRQLEPVPA